VESVKVVYDKKEYINAQNEPRYYNTSGTVLTTDEMDYIGERKVFSIFLGILEPDTEYLIKIEYQNKRQYEFSYKTLPDENSHEKYNIIYAGDVGVSQQAEKMSDVIITHNPRTILLGGDISYDNGDPACYYAMDIFLNLLEERIYKPLGRIVPLILAVGNHDLGINNLADRNVEISDNFPSYLSYFPQETLTDGNEKYTNELPVTIARNTYTLHKIGNTINFVLDSGYVDNYKGPQSLWLQKLAKKYENSPKIALYHNPLYSLYSNFTETASADAQGEKIWAPLFEQYDFLSAFENHVHAMKRTYPLKRREINEKEGVVYLGDGAWGVETGGCRECKVSEELKKLFALYKSANHVWVVSFEDSEKKITYTPYGLDNTQLDTPYVQKY
jgi:hypothetical protein